MKVFEDRVEAGRHLAGELTEYEGRQDVVVLALPRGGVPVALEVATKLKVPLDVFLVRKLGVPGHEELAMGAIASGGVRVRNEDILQTLAISDDALERVAEREKQELDRREEAYRGGKGPARLQGKTVILIDDGLATGASMRAAVKAAREHHPEKVIVAVPTAPPETCTIFKHEADDCVCVQTPETFGGVGRWYQNFSQTTDDEVRELLQEAYEKLPAS